MKKIHTKKFGLFMSVELVVVMVVVAVLVVVAALSSNHLMNMYKIYSISKDFGTYSEAVVKFKQMYTFWPGDLTKDKMTGEMGHVGVIADSDFIKSQAQFLPDFYTPGTGVIGTGKALLSFRQLAAAGLIPQTIVDMKSSTAAVLSSSNFTAGTSLKQLAGVTFPRANFDERMSWYFAVDYNITNKTRTTTDATTSGPYDETSGSQSTFASPVGKNVSLAGKGLAYVYQSNWYKAWENKPRLILFSHFNATSTYSDVPGVGPYNPLLQWSTFEIGSLSSNLAYMIDQKLDDGFAVSPSGNIYGDESSNPSAPYDKTNPKVCSNGIATPTGSPVNSYAYNSYDVDFRCLMFFKIQYNELS